MIVRIEERGYRTCQVLYKPDGAYETKRSRFLVCCEDRLSLALNVAIASVMHAQAIIIAAGHASGKSFSKSAHVALGPLAVEKISTLRSAETDEALGLPVQLRSIAA
jgi:hypothetical protein